MAKPIGLSSRLSGYAELTPPVLNIIYNFAGTPEEVVTVIGACRNVCARWRAAINQSPIWRTYQNICMGRFQVSHFPLPDGADYFFPRGRQDVYLSENVKAKEVSIWDLK